MMYLNSLINGYTVVEAFKKTKLKLYYTLEGL